jgi:hypothetical protein
MCVRKSWGLLHWLQPWLNPDKMKTLFETALGMGARKGFAPIPILRGAILVKRYLISVALRAAWRRIKFSNVGDLARQILPKPFLPSHCKSTRACRIALHDIPVL